MNESISYNGIQLLRQNFLAVAATVAAPCEWTLSARSMRGMRYEVYKKYLNINRSTLKGFMGKY